MVGNLPEIDRPVCIPPHDPRFRITPTQQMVAACSGALLTSLVVTPFDVVKIRLQAQQKHFVPNKCFLYCNGLMDHFCTCAPTNGNTREFWYMRQGHFSGTLDAILKISRNEGVHTLWSGLSPTLVLAVPATVVYFVIYEQLRTRIVDKFCIEGKPQPFWAPLIAGCTARLWAVTLVSPLELIRTKMQSKTLSWLELNEALRSLLKYHGVPGLWKGVGATLLRDVPFSGIYWVTYEKLKHLNDSKTSFFYSFIGGSIAGSLAACVTTPFDVVKTLRQIEMAEKEIITEPPTKCRYSTYSALSSIYRKNGYKGLFAGLTPRIFKVAPACAIMVSTFEYGKDYFQKRNWIAYNTK